jgi:hypothetical protein
LIPNGSKREYEFLLRLALGVSIFSGIRRIFAAGLFCQERYNEEKAQVNIARAVWRATAFL